MTPTLRLLLAGLLLAGSGCSLQELAADEMTPILERGKDDFNRETVPAYARAAGPGLLAVVDAMALASPENVDLRLLQAEMQASFAFAFLEEVDPTWATSHYRKAQRAALAALAEEEEDLAAALADGAEVETLEPLLAAADRDALPALFWWAFGRGSEINLERTPGQMAQLDRVEAVMGWVLERQPGFYNGGPHLFFALRYAMLSASLGGDPDRAREHFEAVERITSGRMLIAQVLRAQHLAPQMASTPAGAPIEEVLAAQRRAWEAYYGGLKAVVEAPPDLWPEQALANAVARERALELLRDPEGHNIIPPDDAENEFAPAEATGFDEWGGADDAAWDDEGQ